jgi:hypothetical protein
MDGQSSDKGSYHNHSEIFHPHGVVPPIGPRTGGTPSKMVPEHWFELNLETSACSGLKALLTRMAKWGSVRNSITTKIRNESS